LPEGVSREASEHHYGKDEQQRGSFESAAAGRQHASKLRNPRHYLPDSSLGDSRVFTSSIDACVLFGTIHCIQSPAPLGL